MDRTEHAIYCGAIISETGGDEFLRASRLRWTVGMVHTAAVARDDIMVAPLANAAEWDAFVESQPRATFAHLAAWRSIIEEVMGKQSRYLCAWDVNGSIRGVLPLFRVSSTLFGARYVSVPYLNDGGPIGSSEAVALLRERARDLADHDGGGRLELRMRVPLPGVIPQYRKATVLLQLPSEADTLWKALPAKVRSQVRRPQKAGMSIRFGARELPAFYRVWSQNMRDLGTPVLPRAFFEAAGAAFPDRFIVGCVYSGDTPVAAGAGFLFRDEFEMTWASSLRSWNRDAPNMLLYWEFMAHAIASGARVFNFGRCTPGEGTHRFKLQWGGESVPLPWVYLGSAPASGGPSSAVRLVSSAWQRLPLAVANLVGPTVAKQLPWW